MPYERELEAALEAAERAGRAVLEQYARFEVIPDAPASITTAADHEAQEIILGHLHQVFPQDALCAEETTVTLAQAVCTGSRLWIVDPIDGTRGFARKNGEFSLMIAFFLARAGRTWGLDAMLWSARPGSLLARRPFS